MHATKVAKVLLELLFEGLGLEAERFKNQYLVFTSFPSIERLSV